MAIPQPPFEAIAVQDFNTVGIVPGLEYTITAVSPDGGRWQTLAADGRPGWFPSRYAQPVGAQVRTSQPTRPSLAQRPSGVSERDRLLKQQAEAQRRAQARLLQQQRLQEEKRKLQEETERMEQARRQHQAASRRQPQYVEERYDDDSVEDMLNQLTNTTFQDTPEEIYTDDVYTGDDSGGYESDGYVNGPQTYTERQGYLAGVPAYDPGLQTYMPETDTYGTQQKTFDPEPAPEPAAAPTRSLFVQTSNNSGDPDGPWKCASCGTMQPKDASKCTMCGSDRAAQRAKVAASHPSSGASDGGASNEGWKCVRCGVDNAGGGERCNMCGSAKPAYVPSETSSAGPTKKKRRPGEPKKKGRKKRTLVSKKGSNVELMYAKKIDVFNYKAGTSAVPGHGAGY